MWIHRWRKILLLRVLVCLPAPKSQVAVIRKGVAVYRPVKCIELRSSANVFRDFAIAQRPL